MSNQWSSKDQMIRGTVCQSGCKIHSRTVNELIHGFSTGYSWVGSARVRSQLTLVVCLSMQPHIIRQKNNNTDFEIKTLPDVTDLVSHLLKSNHRSIWQLGFEIGMHLLNSEKWCYEINIYVLNKLQTNKRHIKVPKDRLFYTRRQQEKTGFWKFPFKFVTRTDRRWVHFTNVSKM